MSPCLHISSNSLLPQPALDARALDGKHLVVSIELNDYSNTISSHALVDCGATGYAFIDETFAREQNFPLYELPNPRALEVIDGRPIESGLITHYVMTKLVINDHTENAIFFVTKLGHYPVVVGIPWMARHDVRISFKTNELTFDSAFCLRHCCQKPVTVQGISPPQLLPNRIAHIAGSTFCRTLYKNQKTLVAYSTTVYELDKALKEPTPEPEDLEDAKIRELVPEDYHSYLPLFKKAIAETLPPHRPYDHKIPLQEGFTPPFGPLYSLSRPELQSLREWIDENLSKGFIRASSSPAGAPILFVKKKDGSLRLCVDYRGLNAGTIKNRYPLPLIRETLLQLSKARYYTTLDIRSAYNLIRMAEGEEWKTAFRTRYGLFESLVMPFGLTNAPADFQRFINEVLHPFLDRFCTAYLDDILIYSRTLQEHKQHVRQVLDALSANGLHLKPEKCEFHRTEVGYLGLIISQDGIKMDPKKVEAITKWESPMNLHDVRAFLGFANFYRRFIDNYSAIVAPMVRLTKKGAPFVWDASCEDAFQLLKIRFTSAPILRHFDPDLEIVVETDASDYVSAGVLSQYDKDGVLHPVAFFSKKHLPAECNYEIYDKELMAIVRSFEEWRAELESSAHPIKVLSDHKNLEYFMSTKLLNRRQARWSEFLSRFNFRIVYRPGKAGGKPDALTRRSGDLPKEGDERLAFQHQTVLKPHNLALNATSDPTERTIEEILPHTTEIEELFKTGYTKDPIPAKVLTQLANNEIRSSHLSLAECKEIDKRLWYRGRLYVPDYTPLQLHLIRQCHDSPAGGHPGRSKTLELLQRKYYWPGMHKQVDRYVRNCHPCQRSRTERHAPFGILRPLPIPEGAWQELSMDFITGLPESNGCNAILNVVDRLTKMRHFVACRDTTTAEELALLYIRNIFRLHGLPRAIISDRGTQFVADFWLALCKHLKIEAKLSTPHHPETDGQTERLNAVLEQYLRTFVNYLQDDWEPQLPLAEFAGNNAASETTGLSPFFANYGFDPLWHFDFAAKHNDSPKSQDAKQLAQKIKEITDHLRSEMLRAQHQHQEYADKHRKPAPVFKIGDQVWFNARFLDTNRPSKKLDHKRIGPYSIVKVVTPYAYEIDFPTTVKYHRVQHVSLLDPASTDPLPGQINPPPPPVIVDQEEEYQVEEILDSRLYGRWKKPQYRVKWVGYSYEHNTWEPAEDLNELEAVDAFHRRYPDKPGPFFEAP